MLFLEFLGYTTWLLSSTSSVPALKSTPQTMDPDRDRSSPDADPEEPSSPKLEEMEMINSDPRPELICIHLSPLYVFPSSQS